MKWFKHETDAHTNLKLQAVLDKYGLEALGFYWVCVELVGLQGENFRLKPEKCWKNYIKKFAGIEIEKQELYLDLFGDLNLIDKKALKQSILSIPKMSERCDEYTDKIRRKSRQSRDNVRLEEKREEEIRTDENKPTPSQIAHSFFEGNTEEMFKAFSKGQDENHIRQEFQKFILYWTEPNKSGTKQRWEQQPTFDVKRRLFTWLSRASSFKGFSKPREVIL